MQAKWPLLPPFGILLAQRRKDLTVYRYARLLNPFASLLEISVACSWLELHVWISWSLQSRKKVWITLWNLHSLSMHLMCVFCISIPICGVSVFVLVRGSSICQWYTLIYYLRKKTTDSNEIFWARYNWSYVEHINTVSHRYTSIYIFFKQWLCCVLWELHFWQ